MRRRQSGSDGGLLFAYMEIDGLEWRLMAIWPRLLLLEKSVVGS
jgi:hypothetical protein